MKVSSFSDIVMLMEFTNKNQAKNIVVNGKRMFVTAKVNGLMRTEKWSLVTIGMINVIVYELIHLLQAKKVN